MDNGTSSFGDESMRHYTKPPQSPSCSGNIGGDAGNFECNICFELAQDPIVTLCGHLFCWPCLYKWLHNHSQCQDCPVCKALIQEEKLVPLYGRGKNQTDPRSRSILGTNIPNRPAGQRPETAPPPDPNHMAHQTFGFMGGAPMAASRFGHFTFSAGFGLFPALFGFQMHGFPDATAYGAAPGFPYGFSNPFHGGHVHGHAHGFPHPPTQAQQQEAMLSKYLLVIGLFVIICFAFL
ncbi:E3 ubiquitin-protein ligase RNF185 isoform X2 [Amborella trichopoda]|uniref:E3 ubiquitin-protein ligase RMA n=2 Tax=Amborella trichopoda TaxID=13333 RepID=U5D587_AMBTC|nr:E3 ubiquitin-protein ligase RNF185 isoform X2 [Amborella trichopoda]XP_011627711.1 E3 ubiquitin-protein ligase RNF185 isoform X2 [Amborella trichopoda]ERN17594.1 hypothetical protein AMTR_s00059p00153580 [Amborella trichopoda]|eukprot:XP_006856127.1 E3 ubiquitin-protein ligase RNF185 isoform X2 [Amborella trichopoda]